MLSDHFVCMFQLTFNLLRTQLAQSLHISNCDYHCSFSFLCGLHFPFIPQFIKGFPFFFPLLCRPRCFYEFPFATGISGVSDCSSRISFQLHDLKFCLGFSTCFAFKINRIRVSSVLCEADWQTHPQVIFAICKSLNITQRHSFPSTLNFFHRE